MLTTFHSTTKIILKILLFFWIFGISALVYWAGISVLNNPYQVIPIVLVFALIALGLGVYFFVLITIPLQFTETFDPIKDKVALRQYTDIEEFQKEVSELLIHFFRFPGLEITGGKFEFLTCAPLEINIPADFETDSWKKPTRIEWIWKFKKNKGLFVPIKIGDRYLGSMILFTHGWTLKIFSKIISDIENNFLDDQILHMISYSKKV